jgi:hypothetical protein
MAALNITEPSQFPPKGLSKSQFLNLCTKIVDTYIFPSIDALEADKTKTLAGNTVSGHAVLLAFDLMTLREMIHSIKYGHPTRMLRMVKFWAPMFYAGRSYNYAHECMELLHNYYHDWPRDSADVMLAGMLVNTTGEIDGFLEGDLDGEHLNKKVKGKTDKPNVTPDTLAKITPALGHIRHVAERLFADLGVEAMNQYHAAVREHEDVELVVRHLTRSKVFQFSKDALSEHPVIDLYRQGLYSLSGKSGAHARHLAKHKLRLRSRHGLASDTYQSKHDEELADDRREVESSPAVFTLDEDGDNGDEDDADDLEEENNSHNEEGMTVD